jgi:hypothetical protein
MRQWLDSGIMDKLLESLADEDVRFLLIGGKRQLVLSHSTTWRKKE